jgi:hypothetical protein
VTVTTLFASKEFYKAILREGKKLVYPNDPSLNPVVKGIEIEYECLGGYTTTKFEWVCAECGTVWFSKAQAQRCRQRRHVKKYNSQTALLYNEMIHDNPFRTPWDTTVKCEGFIPLTDLFDVEKIASFVHNGHEKKGGKTGVDSN